jgi:tetratricopeptide (TPR) repeat protein
MLRPKKKLRRKELKEDKLVTAYFRIYDQLYKYRKQLIMAGAAVIVAVLAIILYSSHLQSENDRALTLLGRVYTYYDEGSYRQAIDGRAEQNILGLRHIAENYGRTEAGGIATFYLANAYYHIGEYDEAYRIFERFGGTDPLLRASALAGRAAIHEFRNEHEEAARLFERAATRFAATAIAPENLKHAGRNYLEAGRHADALRMFEKLRDDHPGSPLARDIDLYIAQISAASS